MKDVYLIMEGRRKAQDQAQYYLRHHAAILSEVFNATMGGSGAFKAAVNMWNINGEEKTEKPQLTNEQRKEIIQRYHEKLRQKYKNG